MAIDRDLFRLRNLTPTRAQEHYHPHICATNTARVPKPSSNTIVVVRIIIFIYFNSSLKATNGIAHLRPACALSLPLDNIIGDSQSTADFARDRAVRSSDLLAVHQFYLRNLLEFVTEPSTPGVVVAAQDHF